MGLQQDRIESMNLVIEGMQTLVDNIYKKTCTHAILQNLHDMQNAAYRADATRASLENGLSRHTSSIRQILQKITEIQREQAAQNSRFIDMESRLDALNHQMEMIKEHIRTQPLRRRDESSTGRSMLSGRSSLRLLSG